MTACTDSVQMSYKTEAFCNNLQLMFQQPPENRISPKCQERDDGSAADMGPDDDDGEDDESDRRELRHRICG